MLHQRRHRKPLREKAIMEGASDKNGPFSENAKVVNSKPYDHKWSF